MKGKIVKGIAGFYYVHTASEGILACRARGIFRKDKTRPLVGDDVEAVITDETDREGNITEILPRKNELSRPACANIDRALITFACEKPAPNFSVIEKMIITLKEKEIPFGICFNKCDLADEERKEFLKAVYGGADVPVIVMSLKDDINTGELADFLKGNTTVLLGPSGAGKSSITNRFSAMAEMEVGDISRKLMRGKNTTRHAELFPLDMGGYIMDTPGFTAIDMPEVDSGELRFYYKEFAPYEGRCRFPGCVHISEPDCRVREALAAGEINETRYACYKALFEEIKEEEKRRYR